MARQLARKTLTVDDLRRTVNSMIAVHQVNCPDDTAKREGLIAVLEFVLHDTGNYKGFRYLDGPEAVHLGVADLSARHYH
jgi:hypothetical protein